MKSTLLIWFCGGLLLLASCGHATTMPDSEMAPVPELQGTVAISAAGEWTLTVDPDALSVALTPVTQRTTTHNDDLYWLSIGNFLRGDSFQIRRVTRTADTLDLTWEFAHPIPAPSDPTAPASAGNRADLGISGLIVFGVDVESPASHTYFTNLTVNTSSVVNPDVYFQPADLLTTWTQIARVFPCQALVSEQGAHGSRLGISNGGSAVGNYGSNGWTRSELGNTAPYTGWTGYGVLHQGQRTSRILQLSLDDLAAGPVQLPVALLVRYQDPRGGTTPEERRTNRLPAVPADTAKFAYRMPHGTWDMPRIRYVGETGGFIAANASTSTLGFQVEDWDVYATETTESDLSLDPVVTHVQPGAAGLPQIELCLPGVIGDNTVVVEWDPTESLQDDDSAYGGDVGADSGLPGDALFFAQEINKPSGTAAGTFTGLLRVSDPEAILGPSLTPLPLSPNLVPLDEDFPTPQFYQTCSVTVSAGQMGAGGGFAIVSDSYLAATDLVSLSDGGLVVAGFMFGPVDFGGGLRDPGFNAPSFIACYGEQGEYRWDWQVYHEGASGSLRDLAEAFDDSVWAIGNFQDSVSIGGGPSISGFGSSDVWVVQINADGTLVDLYGQGTSTYEGGAGLGFFADGDLAVVGTCSTVGTTMWGQSIAPGTDGWLLRGAPNGSDGDWVKLMSSGTQNDYFFLEVDQNDFVTTGGACEDGYEVDGHEFSPYSTDLADGHIERFAGNGTYQWARVFGSTLDSDANNFMADATGLADGTVIAAGFAQSGGDLGGPLITTGGFLVRFQADGDWQGEWQIPGLSDNRFLGLTQRQSGSLWARTDFTGTVDFGGGVRDGGAGAIALLELDTSGLGLTYQRDRILDRPVPSNFSPGDVKESPTGNYLYAGTFKSTRDLDPGPAEVLITANGTQTNAFVGWLDFDGGW